MPPGPDRIERIDLRVQVAFWIGFLIFFLLFVWLFSGILLPFILGMALAYLLDPLADRLERGGMNRAWATISIILMSVLVFALIALIVVPVLVAQLSGFLERLPDYVAELERLRSWFLQTEIGRRLGSQQVGGSVDQVVAQGASWLASVVASVWAGGQALIGIVSLIVVTPVVAFYLLYDWDRMLTRLDALIPRENLDTIRRLAREIDAAMAGFVRGQLTVCIVLGLFYAIGLSIVGLNFGFLIGSVAGLISFIPYVGSIVGFVLSVGVAVVQFWPEWIWVAAVVGVFAVGQFLEGNILQPRLVGSSVGVHPVWLIFALFAFGSLFGFVGLLLAVPISAALGVLVRFGVERYRHSRLYWGQDGSPPDTPAA